MIDFCTRPDRYRHWRLEVDADVANLVMDVDEDGGLGTGYQLKLNSYDLGVDIELNDALQRIRFEHPGVRTVILRSGKDRVFCAGANIRMLAGSGHGEKVNFCKFTNETRIAMEDASAHSGLTFVAAVTGACAGGGYELALSCDQIVLVDDGSSSVSLPEVPLLAVLPGTGGLTRLTDKRKVRRDRADILCCTEEGIKGQRAEDWGLVDQCVVRSKLDDTLTAICQQAASQQETGQSLSGITLDELSREFHEDGVRYNHVDIELRRDQRLAAVSIKGPTAAVPDSPETMLQDGSHPWLLGLARELDDAVLHLRSNEPDIGIIQFEFDDRGDAVLEHDAFLEANADHWLCRETLLYWGRVMRRIDLTSRSLVGLVGPQARVAGSMAEILFACDRIFMAEGEFEELPGQEASITLNTLNLGICPMHNGLGRMETRLIGEPELYDSLPAHLLTPLDAEAAASLGLITIAYDDIDWEDEIRIFIEERASFSADALTGMEANLRFAGPETMETRIFGRLTAWQNWIFQRPNAVGSTGALQRYGSGQKPEFDTGRV